MKTTPIVALTVTLTALGTCLYSQEPPPFNADEMFGWIQDQAELGPRRPGSPANHQAEQYLDSLLNAFGLLNVRKEPIPITYWEAETARLEVLVEGTFQSISTFPIPYTAFTPDEGIEAPLIFLDAGKLRQPRKLNGAIVVTEIGFPPLDLELLTKFSPGHYDPDHLLPAVSHPATWVRLGWHLYRLAVERGATGFIGIIKDQPGGTARMYAPYGFKEKDILDKPLPGFWVGRNDGVQLRQLAESGSGKARITLSGAKEPGVTHNIIGEIPGNSDETIVLSCHHDSPFTSPTEDGSGVAVVLALARHFAERDVLNRRLIILLTAGHFYGSIGTRTFIEEHHSDIVPNVILEITIEHIAREAEEGADGKLVSTGHPEAVGIFVPFNATVADAVVESAEAHDVRRVLLLPAEGPLGDYPPTDGGDWFAAGIPVINYISNPVYLLTDDDALDWVDVERLPKVAGAFADIILRMDTTPASDIAAVDSRWYRFKMKLIKNIARWKTTAFGLKPVY